jgi:hypothetical protein
VTEGEAAPGDGAGTKILLDCGHRITLPWGLTPEAAVADLLHHRASCDREVGVPALYGSIPRLPLTLAIPAGGPR